MKRTTTKRADGKTDDETWDETTGLYTRKTDGAQQEQRPLTPTETAEAAAFTTAVTESTNKKTIEQQAEAAITTNQDFRAIASPANAQVLAQVRALSLQNIKLIRYVFDHLEDDE